MGRKVDKLNVPIEEILPTNSKKSLKNSRSKIGGKNIVMRNI